MSRIYPKLKFLLCSVLMVSLLAPGCSAVHNSMRPSEKSSQWNLFNRKATEKKGRKKKEGPPEKIVVIWKDAVLEKPGTASVRGFGARIYFHDAQDNPVKASGDFMVYGFDDSVTDEEMSSRRPDKKFVFDNEQFQAHFSESDLGPSYSVWIPWEKIGGYRKTIALVPVFKTGEGKTLNGGISNNVLPGKPPESNHLTATSNRSKTKHENSGISQVGFSSDDPRVNKAHLAMLDEEDNAGTRIRTSTINLTPSMASLLTTPNSGSSPMNPTLPNDSQVAQLMNQLAQSQNLFNPNQNTFQPAGGLTSPVKAAQNTGEREGSLPTSKAQPEKSAKTENADKGSAGSFTPTRKSTSTFGAPGSFR